MVLELSSVINRQCLGMSTCELALLMHKLSMCINLLCVLAWHVNYVGMCISLACVLVCYAGLSCTSNKAVPTAVV